MNAASMDDEYTSKSVPLFTSKLATIAVWNASPNSHCTIDNIHDESEAMEAEVDGDAEVLAGKECDRKGMNSCSVGARACVADASQ